MTANQRHRMDSTARLNRRIVKGRGTCRRESRRNACKRRGSKRGGKRGLKKRGGKRRKNKHGGRCHVRKMKNGLRLRGRWSRGKFIGCKPVTRKPVIPKCPLRKKVKGRVVRGRRGANGKFVACPRLVFRRSPTGKPVPVRWFRSCSIKGKSPSTIRADGR